ncbi:MAG: M48 family metalloprotease, partial [Nitrospinota bacterium]|nr:M48 family metalloprotease [Nitrospinota bacterium]
MDDRQPEPLADFFPGGAPGPSPGARDTADDPGESRSHHDEARRYHRTGRGVGIARTALGFLFLAGLLFSGASIALADWTRALTDNAWLGMALFCAVLMIGFEVLTLPLDYFGGHRFARRFGLSRQNAAGWLWDRLKGAGIGLALGLLAFEVFYGLLRGTGPLTFPLWAGAAFLGFQILAGRLAPVLLMPVFFKTRPVEDAGLENRLAELARASGANVRGVYQFDLGRKSRTATAALTGLGKTRRILLSDTLLEGFSHEEISVVLAH